MSLVPGLEHWFILSTLFFAIGLYGVLSRRSAVGVLIGVELMLNSTALNFVIFNRYLATPFLDGAVMMIFVIAVAAAEAVLAMAIFVQIFRSRHSVDISTMTEMRY